MENKKKNEIIAQGNQATPLIADIIANESDTLEIELPADCFKELLANEGKSEYFRDISDISDLSEINNSFDINHIKNVKLRGSGDYANYRSYIILPLRYNSMNAYPHRLEFTDMTLYITGGGPSTKFHNKFRNITIFFNIDDLSIDRIQIIVYDKVYQNET